MGDERVIAEQQYGRNLYNKLKLDFKEELSEGTIIGIGSIPRPALNNIRVGIAFESFEQKDYKTAEAFFSQLEGYEEWRESAAKLWLEDHSKKDTRPKTLIEKIESIEIPSVKFEYAQEKIAKIGERYELVKKAIEGELTLTQIVQQYKKEVKDTLKLREKAFKVKIKEHQIKLVELESIFQEFLKPITDKNKNLESYRIHLTKTVGGATLMGTAPLTLLGGAALLTIIAPFIGAPLVFACGLSAGAVTTGQIMSGLWLLGGEVTKPSSLKDLFNTIQLSSEKIDDTIHKYFITEPYQKDPKVFKKTFMFLDEKEQRYVIKKLIKLQRQNKEVDSWLEEYYKEILEEEGVKNTCGEWLWRIRKE